MSMTQELDPLHDEHPAPPEPPEPRSTKRRWPVLGILLWPFRWGWRILVGTTFCFSGYILSYFTAIMVVGWLYRWAQGRVVHGWWKQSPLRPHQSWEDFLDSLGPDAPVSRPRWFVMSHVREKLNHPGPDGQKPSRLRRAARILTIPFHSAWCNLTLGVQGLLCVFLLTGWGCALMTFSWEFGWLNSFNKGYEQAAIGPLTGLTGIALFIAAMFYVPMAQMHMAVTGDYRAFFHVRFVWTLVQSRITPYVGLAAVIVFLALPLQGLKTWAGLRSGYDQTWMDASDAELLQLLSNFLRGVALYLFVSLLIIYALAARIYQSAVLKALRRGWLHREDLHPRLRVWLEKLACVPERQPDPHDLVKVVRWSARWNYRRVMYALLAVLWFGMVGAQVYVGEFLNYHPAIGFLNHPLVQIPSVDYIPAHLHESATRPAPADPH